MEGICEGCSVCGKQFSVTLRWQMEERDGGFSFFCSRACHSASTSNSAVCCDGCGKRFRAELVSQVIATRAGRRHACSEECRGQLLAEASGKRLGDAFAPVESAPVRHLVTEPVAPRLVVAQPAVDALPRRIAVFNHKGGTGKTTTAVSLAAALATRGKRVLLVDTDAQGNVAASLGVRSDRSLYHVLVMGLSPADAAVSVRPNLDVLPSNETLAAAELYLAGRRERDRVLRDRLSSTSEHYDVVILDCSPSLSLLNQNALVFADALLVPVACDYLSLVGVRQVLKTVKHVNQLLHHPVTIAGVIPTMYDARAKICQDALATLREHFGPRCLTPIRATAKLKEAPAHQRTIFEWAEGSNAARDYDAVVDALIAGVADDATRCTSDRGGRVDGKGWAPMEDDFNRGGGSNSATSSTGGVLAADDVADVLRGAFYVPAGRPTRRVRASAPKPEHYKVICISLYNEDLARLDGLVDELKTRGFTKASRSALIRFALDQVDLEKAKKGL